MPKLSSGHKETYLKAVQMFDGFVPIIWIINALQIIFDISPRNKEEFKAKAFKVLEELHRQQFVVIAPTQLHVKITEDGERYLLKLLIDKLPPNPFDED